MQKKVHQSIHCSSQTENNDKINDYVSIREQIFKKSGSRKQYYNKQQMIEGCDLSEIIAYEEKGQYFRLKIPEKIVILDEDIRPEWKTDFKMYCEQSYPLGSDGNFHSNMSDSTPHSFFSLFELIPNICVLKMYDENTKQLIATKVIEKDIEDRKNKNIEELEEQNSCSLGELIRKNELNHYFQNIELSTTKKFNVEIVLREPFNSQLEWRGKWKLEDQNLQFLVKDKSKLYELSMFLPLHYISHIKVHVKQYGQQIIKQQGGIFSSLISMFNMDTKLIKGKVNNDNKLKIKKNK